MTLPNPDLEEITRVQKELESLGYRKGLSEGVSNHVWEAWDCLEAAKNLFCVDWDKKRREWEQGVPKGKNE